MLILYTLSYTAAALPPSKGGPNIIPKPRTAYTYVYVYTPAGSLCGERRRARVREREEEISPDPLFRVAYINDHVSVCTYTCVCVVQSDERTNGFTIESLSVVYVCISEEKREMDDDAGCSHVLWNQGSV